jgi:hypothetical protein
MSAAGLGFGMRNRIINGAMVIDQRNAGASYSAIDSTYGLDRWKLASYDSSAQTGKYTVIQSSTAPTGFSTSMLITSSAATTINASSIYWVGQMIEGFNTADLGFGAAGASTVTVSFWVRSSLTGTFGGVLSNSASNRSYPFSYTINSANTFEFKTVTIPGDTSGTWLTTNGIGIRLIFNLGSGTTYQGTAGAWSGSQLNSVTGTTSLLATNGATLYISGVQLEKGSTATSFEYRHYTTELTLCQRYCHVFRPDAVATFSNIGFATVYSNTDQHVGITLPVSMRTAPTVTYSSISHIAIHMPGVVRVTLTAASVNTNQSGNYRIVLGTNTASSGDLVSHKVCHCEFNGTSTGFLAFASEL